MSCHPTRTWSTTYQHGRRKHRHRCRCCRRIIETGEPVFMAKIGNRTTWVLHEKPRISGALPCVDIEHSPGMTWRQVFIMWATGDDRRTIGDRVEVDDESATLDLTA